MGKGTCTKSKNCAGMDFAMTLGYIYRRTVKDKGIVLNLCPWCGAKLFPRPSPREKGGGR